MKEKIAEILGCTYVKMTGSCSDCEYNKTNFCQRWSTVDAILALIEQEQKPMREALELAESIVNDSTDRRAGKCLAKIDAVLGGSHE